MLHREEVLQGIQVSTFFPVEFGNNQILLIQSSAKASFDYRDGIKLTLVQPPPCHSRPWTSF